MFIPYTGDSSILCDYSVLMVKIVSCIRLKEFQSYVILIDTINAERFGDLSAAACIQPIWKGAPTMNTDGRIQMIFTDSLTGDTASERLFLQEL